MHKTKILLAAAFATFAGMAQALTVTNVGGNEYQIDFDPITFTVTQGTNDGYGFIVEDFFQADATINGVASGGTFSLSGSSAGSFTNAETSAPRGAYSSAAGALDPNDLLVGVGNGPYFDVTVGDVVTISGAGLRFTVSGALPAFSAATTFDVALIDNFVTVLGTTTIDLAPVPLPAGSMLLLSALAGGALALRRVRRAA
jgi:hypothetical protein